MFLLKAQLFRCYYLSDRLFGVGAAASLLTLKLCELLSDARAMLTLVSAGSVKVAFLGQGSPLQEGCAREVPPRDHVSRCCGSIQCSHYTFLEWVSHDLAPAGNEAVLGFWV